MLPRTLIQRPLRSGQRLLACVLLLLCLLPAPPNVAAGVAMPHARPDVLFPPAAAPAPRVPVQLAQVAPANLPPDTFFGTRIALAGDLMVVGSAGENTNRGAVYVFTRSTTRPHQWDEGARLTASDGASGDAFGKSIAVSGSMIAVGAPTANANRPFSGAVYLFERVGDTGQWAQVYKLVPPASAQPQAFGFDVTMQDATLVIGAYWDESTCRATTYSYTRDPGGTWNLVHALANTGGALALSGTTLVTGSACANGNAGSVSVFTQRPDLPGAWTPTDTLIGDDTIATDEFGSAVAVDGNTVVVGARRAGSYTRYAGPGAAYIFTRDQITDSWIQQKILPHDYDPFSTAGFGSTVAVRGATVLVGAPEANSYRGNVYVFEPDSDTPAAWRQAGALIPPLPTESDYHGTAVATDGDTLFESAPLLNRNRGAVTTFRLYAPPIVNDDAAVTDEDTAVAIDVLANDRASEPIGPLAPESLAIVSAPRSGTAQIFTTTHTITYTPSPDFAGSDSLTYAVANTAGVRATATVSLTVQPVADPPRIVSQPLTTTIEGERYAYRIAATDPDSGDVLTITVPISPAWLALTPHQPGVAVLSGTPPVAAIGAHPVQVRVQDQNGLEASQSFTITVQPYPLVPPTDLVAVPAAAQAMTLRWRNPTQRMLGYRIERRTATGAWAQIGTTPADSTSFTDTTVTCGETYIYQLRAFNDYAQSEPSVTAQATPAILVQRTYRSTDAAIPLFDYDVITSSLTITDVGTVADLDVQVTLDHIYNRDLTLTLIAPSGKRVALASHTGGFTHDFHDTLFDDAAEQSIQYGSGPFSGRFRPAVPLTSFDNESIQGQWVLEIDNRFGPFRGMLHAFSLTLTTPAGCDAAAMSHATAEAPATKQLVPAPAIMQMDTITPTWTSIDVGTSHVCAVQSNGAAGCWGYNSLGQTDLPPDTYRRISAGDGFGCAIKADATLVCWGELSPNKTTPPTGTFTDVQSGAWHSCAIRTDSTVACWGYNVIGSTEAPTGTFTQISVGFGHSCGVRPDRTLTCWGIDWHGQASPPAGAFLQVSAGHDMSCGVRADTTLACWGAGDAVQTEPPTGSFASVTAGQGHACALRTDGTLVCWGANDAAQARPPAGTFTQVSAQDQQTCAIRATAERPLVCWGGFMIILTPGSLPATTVGTRYQQQLDAARGAAPYRFAIERGQLPDGVVLGADGTIAGVATQPGIYNVIVRATDSNGLSDTHPYTIRVNPDPAAPPAPAPPLPDTPLTAAPETLGATATGTCALRADGTIKCWGYDAYNAIRPPSGSFIQIGAGGSHSCAVRSDGRLACWGSDSDAAGYLSGQIRPPAGTFTQVSAGESHSCGVRSSGKLACWGSNGFGRANPPDGRFVQVSGGSDHTCALRTNRTLACWGSNMYGQATAPGGTFTQISSRRFTSCAVRIDGTLACWGLNDHGQATPLAGQFSQVAVGQTFACGLHNDGSVACWGDGYFNEIEPPSGSFVQISLGLNHGCALQSDGTARCWGRAELGATNAPADAFARTPAAIPPPLPPRVPSIATDADPLDGVLQDGDVLVTNTVRLVLSFDYDIAALKPDALVLWAEGDVPGFQNIDCASVQLGDAAARTVFRSVNYADRTYTLDYGMRGLPDGQYRLIICDTIVGSYPLLDGDSSGQAGGSVVLNFRVRTHEPPPTEPPTETPPSEPPPTETPTPLPPEPPAQPQLALDYNEGKPGSAFTLVCRGFPTSSAMGVLVQGQMIGSLATDEAGQCRVVLQTLDNAFPGTYWLEIVPAQDTAALEQHPSAQYTLRADAPLHAHDADDSTPLLLVPRDIRPAESYTVSLPLMQR